MSGQHIIFVYSGSNCPPQNKRTRYTWPGSNWRPSARWADVIATRPQVLIDDGAGVACLQLPAKQQGTRYAGGGDLAGQQAAQRPFNLQHGGVSSKAVVRRHKDRSQRREHTNPLPDQCCAASSLQTGTAITSTCGLVAMTSASHAEGRQLDPGQV